MVLGDDDGTVAWTTDTSSTGAARAELLDSGNLVLEDVDSNILWRTFDFPTDTLLLNQPFTKSTKLVSRLGNGTYASGYFMLYFNESTFRLMYDGPDISIIYWPNSDYNVWQNLFWSTVKFMEFEAPDKPKCSCPPVYEVTEPANWNKGCTRSTPQFNRTCSK
ncbi:hypothetical protein Pint_16775 [Pistacia integerrima]|uniref:Uncharacterized protein n=1 Tax=Pistacia integerrima TaxID=434235 RepID=A0ACC0Z9K6_9ROSI|nr:hypothetical protein Pint_16775 [Pistacia integerrima]